MYQFTINNKSINQFISLLAMLMITTVSMAQSSIKLLDEKTHTAIVGATYRYGEQTGVSDEMGVIALDIKENQTLLLSHLMYGDWELSAREVQAAAGMGVIYKVERLNDIQPVTVVALRGNKGLNDGMVVDNIAKMNHDAGAVLSQNVGISTIKKSGNYGFDPVLRGFKYDRLNIVINGTQAASAACPNRMDPPTSQMTTNMMEGIEIMKGPHSLRYGPAFGGTINFKTAKMKFSDQIDYFGRASTNYESNGGILRGEGMIGLRSKVYEAKFFGSWSQGDDYKDGEGVVLPSSFNRGSFGADFGLKISGNQTMKLSATHNFAKDVLFPALRMDLRSDDTWMFNGAHHIYFDKRSLTTWTTTVYSTTVNHVMDNLGKNLSPRKLNAVTNAHTRNYGGRTEGIWKFDNKKLYIGADYRLEMEEGSRVRDMLLGPAAGKSFTDNVWQNSRISKLAVFGEYHLPTDFMNWVVSARLEMNHAQADDLSDEFIGVYPDNTIAQLNPSFSVGGSKVLENGLVTGIWLGRAQRSGGIMERYINFLAAGQDPYELLGNPLLDPEANNQIDVKIGYRGKKSVLDVSLFAAYMTDYISAEIREDLSPKLPTSPGVRQFVNIDKARMYGFEVSWAQLLWKGIQQKVSLAYTNGEDLVINQPLPEIAPMDLRYTLLGHFLDDKLEAEASFRYVWAQNRVSVAYKEGTSPAFSLIDIKAGYQIGQYLQFSAGVQNLLDVAYYEHLSRVIKAMDNRPLYAPGRNVFAALTVKF